MTTQFHKSILLLGTLAVILPAVALGQPQRLRNVETSVTKADVKNGIYLFIESADNLHVFQISEPCKQRVVSDTWRDSEENNQIYKNTISVFKDFTTRSPTLDSLELKEVESGGGAYSFNSDEDMKLHRFVRARLVSHNGQYKDIDLREGLIPVKTPAVIMTAFDQPNGPINIIKGWFVESITLENGYILAQITKIPKRGGGFRNVWNAYELDETLDDLLIPKPHKTVEDPELLKSLRAGITSMREQAKGSGPGTSFELYPMGATVLDYNDKDTGHKAGAVYVIKGSWSGTGANAIFTIADRGCLRCELKEKQSFKASRSKGWYGQ